MKKPIFYRVPIVNAQICQHCSHRSLKEDIPLGTMFLVAIFDIITGTMKCGGCGKEQEVKMVPVMPVGFMSVQYFRERVIDVAPINKDPRKDLIN